MKVDEIFLAALDNPTLPERTAFLDTVCGGNAGLRAQVEGLLSSHAEAGSFLDAPLFGSAPTIDRSATSTERRLASADEIPLDFLTPSTEAGVLGRIGPYDVTEIIGRGGMGVVLKARDATLNRVVAIKVLALGWPRIPRPTSGFCARRRPRQRWSINTS